MIRARILSVGVLSALMTVGLTAPAASAETQHVGEIESLDGSFANALPAEFGTACPEMTDSVARLYSAFFLRLPDEDGWDYWLNKYAEPTSELLDIAEAFVASEEFQLTYGSLSNAEFVTLVYANVLEREPDPDGMAHWTGALDGGYARGRMMLSFSESEEYVTATETEVPLAGYLLAYTPSVAFTCGLGTGTMTPPAGHKYMDIAVFNTGTEPATFNLIGLDANGVVVERVGATIDGGFYEYSYNIDLEEGGYASIGVEGPDSGTFWHTIVSYPHPHSADRPGWGL